MDLFKYIHRLLFLRRLFDFVVRAYRYHLRAFAMVEVMSPQQCHNGPFHDENDIPSSSELDEACPPFH